MTARRAIGAILGTGLVLATAAPALAHTEVTGTNPRSGVVLKRLPGTITISFTEPPQRVLGVKVLRSGRDHATAARLNPTNARQILIRTGQDQTGPYRVVWNIRAPDGDLQTGSFGFRVSR